jgi:hypothetical protein
LFRKNRAGGSKRVTSKLAAAWPDSVPRTRRLFWAA